LDHTPQKELIAVGSDRGLHRDIVKELRWEPSLRSGDITVSVRNGIVTLGGFVTSYAEECKAEQVAGRVKGVRAVANDVDVKLPLSSTRPDSEITRAALDALEWHVSVPQYRVKLKVEKGWLTLQGNVEWYFQKKAAETAVRYLMGLKGLTNRVSVQSSPALSDVTDRIKETLQRAADVYADQITVELKGSKVILRGTVRSYIEMRRAERAVRNAPGITDVGNLLTVRSKFRGDGGKRRNLPDQRAPRL
jgi:osmotically-inducible protein OsmY